MVSPSFAMDTCIRMHTHWVEARRSQTNVHSTADNQARKGTKWQRLADGTLKINVDASVLTVPRLSLLAWC